METETFYDRKSSVIAAKYEAFEQNGFCRTRTLDRRDRCAALSKIWFVL